MIRIMVQNEGRFTLKYSEIISALQALVSTVPANELGQLSQYKAHYLLDGGIARVISDIRAYRSLTAALIDLVPVLRERFPDDRLLKFVDGRVFQDQPLDKPLTDARTFFSELLAIKPFTLRVRAPVSGVRLDNGDRSIKLGAFTFGYADDVKSPITEQMKGMYISVKLSGLYDNAIAQVKAEAAFEDAARMIVFLSGRSDQSIVIRRGLPLLPDAGPIQMHVGSSSFEFGNEDEGTQSWKLQNSIVERVPLNDAVFCNNAHLSQLWTLHERVIGGHSLSELEARILNSALAIGESATTRDRRNSVIYTCIALEMMFSRDDGALFQKSIGNNVADLFVFVAAKDLESRKALAKFTKKVYGMRSAIVHGGSKSVSSENHEINFILRAAIGELLTSPKFKSARTLQNVFEMMQDAQYSYTS